MKHAWNDGNGGRTVRRCDICGRSKPPRGSKVGPCQGQITVEIFDDDSEIARLRARVAELERLDHDYRLAVRLLQLRLAAWEPVVRAAFIQQHDYGVTTTLHRALEALQLEHRPEALDLVQYLRQSLAEREDAP